MSDIEEDKERLMKSLNYELDKIMTRSSKVETATEILNLRQPITYMFLNLLAEREQDKKIIKELEEQVKILDEAYTGVIKESKKWFDIAHSRISKQKVKYVIKNETINISGFECIAVENLEELLEDK